MSLKRRIKLSALILTGLLSTPVAHAATHLVITNDSYGTLTLSDGSYLWSKAATYINALRKSGEKVFWIDGGNHLGPAPEATFFKGERHAGLLASLPIDFSVPGPLDFMWGKGLLAQGSRAWLVSNVSEGGTVWGRDKNLTWADQDKFRLFGIVDPQTEDQVRAGRVADMVFTFETAALTDLLSSVPTASEKQRQIVLAQIPYERCVRLLQDFPNIRTVVCLKSDDDNAGVDGVQLYDGRQVLNTQPCDQRILDVILPDNPRDAVSVKRVNLTNVAGKDQVIDQLVSSLLTDYNEQSTGNVGSLVDTDSSDFVRTTLKAMAAVSDIPIAVLPLHAFGATPSVGALSLRDLRKALPEDDQLVAARYSGAELRKWLDQGVLIKGSNQLSVLGYDDGMVDGFSVFDQDHYWVVGSGSLLLQGVHKQQVPLSQTHYVVDESLQHAVADALSRAVSQDIATQYQHVQKTSYTHLSGALQFDFHGQGINGSGFSGVAPLSGSTGSGLGLRLNLQPQWIRKNHTLTVTGLIDIQQQGSAVLANRFVLGVVREPVRDEYFGSVPFIGANLVSALLDPEGDGSDILQRITAGFSTRFPSDTHVRWGIAASRRTAKTSDTTDVGAHITLEQTLGQWQLEAAVFQAFGGTQEQELQLLATYTVPLGTYSLNSELQLYQLSNSSVTPAASAQRLALWLTIPLNSGEY